MTLESNIPHGCEVKLFEVRDKGTCYAVMGLFLLSTHSELTDKEKWLLLRQGYGGHGGHIILMPLSGALMGETHYDVFSHTRPDLREAHLYLEKNWYSLKSGDTIDLEEIRGNEPLGSNYKGDLYRDEQEG